MILNELTNEYALEAVREDTWEKCEEETRQKCEEEAYQQKLEFARNLKESGISLEVIANSLKLPLEVVEGL